MFLAVNLLLACMSWRTAVSNLLKMGQLRLSWLDLAMFWLRTDLPSSYVNFHWSVCDTSKRLFGTGAPVKSIGLMSV